MKAATIRSLIAEGDVRRASRLLGRPYSATADRVPGRGLGGRLGFPTINLPWPESKVMLRYGVYAVRVASEAFGEHVSAGEELKADAVANLGIRPTVDSDRTEPILEVHLLGPREMVDTVSRPIPQRASFTVEFRAFLREEMRFESLDWLRKQIRRDCTDAIEVLRGTRRERCPLGTKFGKPGLVFPRRFGCIQAPGR